MKKSCETEQAQPENVTKIIKRRKKKPHRRVENYWRSNMQFDISMTTEKSDVQWQYWLFNKLLFWSEKRENSCYLTCAIPLSLTGLFLALLIDQMFTEE